MTRDRAFLKGLRNTGGFLATLLLAGAAFIAASLAVPVPGAIRAAVPASGFLPAPLDFLSFLGSLALLAYWTARGSAVPGWKRVGQVAVLVIGAQTFMTQIETAYFLEAFPLLQGSFETYRMVLRGALWGFAAAAAATLLTGGFRKTARLREPRFTVDPSRALARTAILGAVYLVLYMLFGYYVAWQSEAVRLFYSGNADKLGFFAQWGRSFMEKPEIPVFQWFRGCLWVLCLVPLFRGFTGGRVELTILSGLALGILPTAQLAFPNPLMPPAVSLAHFWEVSVSTGLLGALAALWVPEPANPAGKPEVRIDR